MCGARSRAVARGDRNGGALTDRVKGGRDRREGEEEEEGERRRRENRKTGR